MAANVISNYLAGREFADNEKARGYENKLRAQDVAMGQQFQNLAHNANATPDQYARIGRSDVSNALVNQERYGEEKKQAAAGRLFLAAQWVNSAPQGQTKAFIEQNFPELVQHAGPQWATATDDQVRQQLQGIAAKFGAQAGVAPAPQPVKWVEKKGPRGSIIQENPLTGEQRQVIGPDNSQPNPNASGSRTYRDIQSLRKEFDSQQAVKDYKLVLPLYQRAKTAPDTRAGDISVIYALGKMFDPGSVVREGELVLSQNAAPWLQKLTSNANSQLTGEGALAPELRADILKALDGQVQALRAPYQMERERFAGYADENGWQPGQVVGADVGGAFEQRQPTEPQDLSKLSNEDLLRALSGG